MFKPDEATINSRETIMIGGAMEMAGVVGPSPNVPVNPFNNNNQ